MLLPLFLCTAVLAAAAAAAPEDRPSCVVVHDNLNHQTLKLERHGADGIRVRAVPAGGVFRDDLVSALVPLSGSSGGVGDGVGGGPAACPSVVLDGNGSPRTDATPAAHVASVASGNLRAAVGPDGRLAFSRASDSKLLLSESAVRRIAPTGTVPPIPGTSFSSLNVTFDAVDGERVYGLGQHRTGILDYKRLGRPLPLAPRNTEILIPVAHSSLGYVLLFNLPSFGSVHYGSSSSTWLADAVLQMDLWVATTADSPPHDANGSPWQQLQAAYADATGHAPVLPEWASGFWQCKNRYRNQSQVMDVADGHLDRGYPIQLVVIDYLSWKPGPLGDETLPAECWPDPRAMVDQLKARGVEMMISPYFHSIADGSKYYDAARRKGLLVLDDKGKPAKVAYDNAYLYDLFQPAARDFAFAAVEAGYIRQYGLHHWWLDCDEPCGSGSMANLAYNNGTWPASFVGAAYPQMLERMVFEGMGAKAPTTGEPHAVDNVMLGRSAWAGSQRYGAAVWSGDTSSTFEELNRQFRAGLNMAMSGIPYWTTDIGGYGGGNISSPLFRELVVRWFQWGAFCPLFRNHGRRSGGPNEEGGGRCGRTGASNEIWNFGDESEAAIARVMRLRDQLRPYVMEQYRAAARNGTPVMRPLFFDFWNDAGSQMIDDQFMFGPLYMVAPQLHQGGTSRTVYLPPLGGNGPVVWQNVFTKAEYDTSRGGINISEATPLSGDGFGTFPLYFMLKKAPYPPPPPPPLASQ